MQLQEGKPFYEYSLATGHINPVKEDAKQNNRMVCRWVRDKNSQLSCKWEFLRDSN